MHIKFLFHGFNFCTGGEIRTPIKSFGDFYANRCTTPAFFVPPVRLELTTHRLKAGYSIPIELRGILFVILVTFHSCSILIVYYLW